MADSNSDALEEQMGQCFEKFFEYLRETHEVLALAVRSISIMPDAMLVVEAMYRFRHGLERSRISPQQT